MVTQLLGNLQFPYNPRYGVLYPIYSPSVSDYPILKDPFPCYRPLHEDQAHNSRREPLTTIKTMAADYNATIYHSVTLLCYKTYAVYPHSSLTFKQLQSGKHPPSSI